MKTFALICSFAAILTSCNNSDTSKDPVEKADSTNQVKEEKKEEALKTNEATADFLVKAADGGMAEVAAGKLALEKATNKKVKKFAAMMVQDHGVANGEVKALAVARNITLPTAPSDEHKDDALKLDEKSGNKFDKDFMDMMVSNHKKTIDLFEKAADKCDDAAVKSFITSTLPTLRMHLDSAQVIKKSL